jgi:hypothetical protein
MSADIINIAAVEHLGGHRLRLRFDDGSERTIDFRPFLAASRHPDIRAFLDAERFLTYRIEYGDLVWGDFDLSFPITDLYRGELTQSPAQSSAA